MRLHKFAFFAFAFVMCMGLCMTSCGGDDETTPTEKPGEPSDPVNPTPTPQPNPRVMTPDEQQAYLEEVALELNNTIRVEDFDHYVDLANYLSDRYGDDYDWDDVGDWAEDIMDGLKSDLLGTSTKTEKEESSWGNYVYNYIYNNYKATILASNFKGHWTARDGKWQYSDADDIQFIFTNEKQQECVLRLATSGKVVPVHLFNLDDWIEDEWDEVSDRNYVSNEYYDRTAYTIGVPQKIEVTLTEDGKSLIRHSMDIDIASISGEEFDLSKSSISFNSTTTMNNGYTVNARNVKYTASSASTQVALTKNNVQLMALTFSTDLKNVPSKTLTDWYDMDDDEVENTLDNTTATSAAFAIDFLGKVQVKATINDIHKLADELDNADENEQNESAFKRAIERANTYYNAHLYYNGWTEEQATVTLEPFKDYEWSNNGRTETYWDAEPIIIFPNGASYSFDEYFTEDAFKDLIDAIEDQGDTAEDMWD